MGWKQRAYDFLHPHAKLQQDLEDLRVAASNYADKPWGKAGREVYWPELLDLLELPVDDPDPYTLGWETGAAEVLEWLRKWRYEHPRDVSGEVVKALEKLVERGYPR